MDAEARIEEAQVRRTPMGTTRRLRATLLEWNSGRGTVRLVVTEDLDEDQGYLEVQKLNEDVEIYETDYELAIDYMPMVDQIGPFSISAPGGRADQPSRTSR